MDLEAVENKLDYKEVLLKKIKFGVIKYLSKDIVDSLILETSEETSDFLSKQLVLSLKGFILGEENKVNITKGVYFNTPLNWWEMFKEQYFSKWLIKKFPIKFRTETKYITLNIKERFTYPKLPIEVPEFKDITVIRHLDIPNIMVK